jgi:hypothetical protein
VGVADQPTRAHRLLAGGVITVDWRVPAHAGEVIYLHCITGLGEKLGMNLVRNLV